MAGYEVEVVVHYNFEVEADSKEEAEEQGWHYEDYAHYAEVYSIHVNEVYSDEEDEDGETED